MGKLQSRNEIFKDEIAKTNKYISESTSIFNFDVFVNTSFEELIKIDKEYYTNLKTRLTSEYDNFQFHLDHDIIADPNNYEILASIDDTLTYLKELESKDIGLLDDEQSKFHFDEKNFYSEELKELFLKLIDINNSYFTKYKESKVAQTNYFGEDNRTLAKNILSQEKVVQVKKRIDTSKTKNELIREINRNQNYAMHELERHKKKYKFKIKKFIIIFSVFALIGVLGILIGIFV